MQIIVWAVVVTLSGIAYVDEQGKIEVALEQEIEGWAEDGYESPTIEELEEIIQKNNLKRSPAHHNLASLLLQEDDE